MTAKFDQYVEKIRNESDGWFDDVEREVGIESTIVTVLSEEVNAAVINAITGILVVFRNNDVPVTVASRAVQAYFEGCEVDKDAICEVGTVYGVTEWPK